MKKYSLTTAGLLVAVALPLLVQLGFSEGCANELTSKLTPIVSALPGIVMAWIGRIKAGGINAFGVRTDTE